ncbi:MAG: Rne/Rng family ribonuclease [Thermoleophilaceae bacterium]|nr:Rne/Rng family ribonuclease [Thermoleophilaceae bacterium]
MKKRVIVTVDRGETRVAILEAEGDPSHAARDDNEKPSSRRRRGGRRGAKKASGLAPGERVAELYIERRGSRSIVGNIYKGKVDNVLPGLEAAFVDIGLDKNGFLHVDDIVMPGVEVQRRGRGGKGQRIGELLEPGQEIIVQVMKDPLKTKGARLTMQLSIAGRYLVYVPTAEGVGVSRRLDDKERDRLRKETRGLDLKEGGAIIRTAARGAKREDFERELKYLYKLYEILQRRAQETVAPAMVFQEADLPVRVVRDIFSSQFEEALVDDGKAYERLTSFLARTAPELVDRIELVEDDEPLFERFGIDKVLQSTLSRRVDLPSGGYLMIDYAEAMTVIDVNSGSFIGRGKGAKLEDTITKTNLEAAEEVVRQLRLRDIGGIIVIDFIDMARARNRDAVLKTLRKELDEDRTKTYVMEISPLGLVEMTRQNVTDGVREILTKTCPTCNGDGVVLSEETVALDVQRKLRELALERPEPEAFLVQVHPRVASTLLSGPGTPPLLQLEDEVGKHFHFEGSEGLPIDHFAVSAEGTREEIEERALPFREGEEVLVTIEEPHMYNEEDAVAKIDGYVISVANAVRQIGEQVLVRIESVSRTSAQATIVGSNGRGEPAQAAAPDDGEPAETGSSSRRRGRRGGRRRRASTAGAPPEEAAAAEAQK